MIIDPVLDYEPGSGKVWTESVERVAAFVEARKLTVSGFTMTRSSFHPGHSRASATQKSLSSG